MKTKPVVFFRDGTLIRQDGGCVPASFGVYTAEEPFFSPGNAERVLEEKAALPKLYRELGERFAALDSWSMYLITAYENAQQDIGRKADKNRKIYNGMMKTYFYQYSGPKPPKRRHDAQARS